MSKEKISNIFYTDAGYGFEAKIPENLTLFKCETYGFTFSSGEDLFVHFIKKAGEEIFARKIY